MKKKTLLVGLASLLFPMSMAGQYSIYPIPQQQVAGTGCVSFTPTVNIVCEAGIDAATRARAEQVLTEHGLKVQFSAKASSKMSNLFIGIAGSKKAADKKAGKLKLSKQVFGVPGKFDRHVLALSDEGKQRAGLLILGEHTNAAFYALASLEQMLDNGTNGLPCVTLNDYADQKSRGLVEGYYGYPYSVEVKKDLMRFLMRHKMNTYLYGAKSDPYHSQYWKDPYPTTLTAEQVKHGWLSQDMVKEVSKMSEQTKVNFIWAIHPGDDFVYKTSAIDDIMAKFGKMHDLGVRQFAVFVDDVSIPDKDEDLKANADHLTMLQHAMEKKWNTPDALPTDTVRPLHFVPQIYCTGFAPNIDQYNRFFKALGKTPSYITVYTTGADVWSVPNSADLEQPKKQLGRDVAWWWNYPCNDNADGQIYPLDMYSIFVDMPAVADKSKLPPSLAGGLGIVSNPMQQGEVSKTPLFSVADYAWNTKAFDNKRSWEASFKAVLPGNEAAQKAYRFLAPYLSYNDTEELAGLAKSFKETGNSAQLLALMQQIQEHCATLMKLKDSPVKTEQLLYADLAPWLLKLHSMAQVSQGLVSTAASADNGSKRWESYIELLAQAEALSTKEEFKAYALEGMGNHISTSVRPSQPSQRTLLPLVDYLKLHALDNYLRQAPQTDAPRFVSNAAGAQGETEGTQTLAALLKAPLRLAPGEWAGIELPAPTQVAQIALQKGAAGKYTVVVSPNGKQWTRLNGTTTQPQGYVRYLGIANTGKRAVTLPAGKLPVALALPEATQVSEATIPNHTVWDDHNADKLHDGDYTTFTCLNRGQNLDDTYTLKLSKPQPIHRVRLALGTTNGDYMKEGCIQISADGKQWTNLNVLGTKDATFGIEHPQMEAYSYDAKWCDFDGEGREAQYVRFALNKLNDGKWLRVYELEVNGKGTFAQPHCQDGQTVGYPQTNDADPSSSTAKALKSGAQGELTYHFQNYSLLKEAVAYCNAKTMAGVRMEATRDLKNWVPVEAQATNGVVRIPLNGELADAVALRFVWSGNTAPAIHEIIEVAAEGLPAVKLAK